MTLKVVFDAVNLGRIYYNEYDNSRLHAFSDLQMGKETYNGSCQFSFTTDERSGEALMSVPYNQWVIGQFSFSALPGCCGVVVSHNTRRTGYLYDQNRLLSDRFRRIKEAFAEHLGYSVMIATTDMANLPAVGNMFKSNYKIVDTFNNKRTDHLIGIGIKKL